MQSTAGQTRTSQNLLKEYEGLKQEEFFQTLDAFQTARHIRNRGIQISLGLSAISLLTFVVSYLSEAGDISNASTGMSTALSGISALSFAMYYGDKIDVLESELKEYSLFSDKNRCNELIKKIGDLEKLYKKLKKPQSVTEQTSLTQTNSEDTRAFDALLEEFRQIIANYESHTSALSNQSIFAQIGGSSATTTTPPKPSPEPPSLVLQPS